MRTRNLFDIIKNNDIEETKGGGLNYRKKYLKYKNKYFKLKNTMYGGDNGEEKKEDRIDVSTIDDQDTSISILNTNSDDKYKNYLLQIQQLYKICEPDESSFEPLNEFSKIILLFHNDIIIGFLVITNTETLENDPEFEDKGGIIGSKDLFVTSVCGNKKYKRVLPALLDELNIYKNNEGYQRIFLHVSMNRNGLSDYYNSLDFVNIGQYNDNKFIIMEQIKHLKK
jgi:hypothetical protein